MKIKGPSLAVKSIYEKAGYCGKFAEKNSWLINCAIKSGLAVCGSVGVGVATRHPQKAPSDLDFVTDEPFIATEFFSKVENFLANRSVHYVKLVNHKTKFCPKFAVSHYRLRVPFWMEVCVFVLDRNKLTLDSFFIEGVHVQNYRQMYDAAKDLEERDKKPRISRMALSDDEEYDAGDDFDSPNQPKQSDGLSLSLDIGEIFTEKQYPKQL